MSELTRLQVDFDPTQRSTIQGYGGGKVTTLGTATVNVQLDEIDSVVDFKVVPDFIQPFPVLIGHPITELPGVVAVKNDQILRFLIDPFPDMTLTEDSACKKILLYAKKTLALKDHLSFVELKPTGYRGDVYVEASVRTKEGEEYCIPRTVLRFATDETTRVPLINLSGNDILVGGKQPFLRVWPCKEGPSRPRCAPRFCCAVGSTSSG